MGALGIYILKSTICLAIFYLFHRLLLSKETFYRYNRRGLLGILCLSYIGPLLEITIRHSTAVNEMVMSLEAWLLMFDNYQGEAVEEVSPMGGLGGMKGVMALYMMGISCFCLVRLYALWKICFLLRSSRKQSLDNGVYLYLHQEQIAPFSWMHRVVMKESDFLKHGEMILAHECAHIKNHHSWDLLLADFLILFQWFNPAVWMLRKELKDIHEYEVDEYVLNQHVDIKQYQLLLIEKAVGTRLYSMANSLNHSSLKKRITMMIKKKSNPWARLKYLYLLPVATFAVVAFARPEISERMEEISNVKVREFTLNPKAKEGKSVEKLETMSQKSSLVIVDGVKRNMSALKQIPPQTIASMHIWKGEEAIKRYGEQGKNGVIEISLK